MKKVASALWFGVCLLTSSTWAAVNKEPAEKHPKWLLNSFIDMSSKNPMRLLSLADKLFSSERLRITSVEPTLAFEWQHRLAMVSALSEFFDGKMNRKQALNSTLREHARQIIRKAMDEDPSLLVRDGSVESVRRIVRMQPGERNLWRKPLEEAFLSPKNTLGGEGFFIRETILTALREASLKPSEKVKQAAQKDKNPEVRNLLKAWRTQAYDEL